MQNVLITGASRGLGLTRAYLASGARVFAVVRRQPSDELLALHPGWVRTGLGGADAPLSVEDSVSELVEVMEAEAGQPGCRFLDHQGQVLSW